MRKEIIYLMLIFLLAAGSASGFLLLIPFLTKDLHFSLTQAGIIGGAFSFARIFAVIPLTNFSRKIGALLTLFIAMGIYGFGFLFMNFSSNFFVFTILFLIIGMSISIFQPLIFGLSTRLTEESNRGKVMGFVTSGSDLGRIGIAGAISFLATQNNWRVASLSAGFVTFLFLFIAIAKRPHITRDIKQHEENMLEESKKLIKNGKFLLSSVLVFFDTIASATLFIYLPFLMFYRHIPLTLMPLFITVFFLGSLVGKLYLGRLTDKFQNTVVFILCELSMAICLIIIAQVTSMYLFGFLCLVLGILTKGTVPAALTIASESIGNNGNYEHAFAFNYVILSVANTVTPFLVGVIADRSSIVYSFYACAAAAILATIPAFLFHSLRKKKLLVAEELASLS